MFYWTSDLWPTPGVQRGSNGHVPRPGVTRLAHDPAAQNDHRDTFQRLRDQITVWMDSDR